MLLSIITLSLHVSSANNVKHRATFSYTQQVNGFHAAGYNGVRGMCWFHVTKVLKTRFLPLDNADAADLNEDICYMQRSQTPTVFESGNFNIYMQLKTSNKITNSYITLLAASLFLRK